MTTDTLLGALSGALLVVPAAGYGAGVVRLGRRGDRWPRSRSAAFAAGLVALAVALLPPVGTHDSDFRVHVVQHVLIAMGAPLLLALSAPVTLALRVTSHQVRVRLLRVLRSRAVHAISTPAVVAVVEVGSLYGLYLTPVYAESEAHLWVHVAVHLHLIATGCLFSWAVAGRDPMPHPVSTRARLLLLFTVAGSHDLLAKMMYAHDQPGGAGSVAPVRSGAQLMFYGGDVIEVALAVAVLTAWYVRGGRDLRRADRRTPRPAQPVTRPATAVPATRTRRRAHRDPGAGRPSGSGVHAPADPVDGCAPAVREGLRSAGDVVGWTFPTGRRAGVTRRAGGTPGRAPTWGRP